MTLLSIDRPAAGSTSSLQRGACPALSAPMATGDGLLARIALTEAMSPAQLTELCRLAIRHGNGMLDISARGNLQLRGLTEASAPRLDADVRALDLPLREGLAVEVPPLAGLDTTEIADPRPLAEAIRRGARSISGLAPKMSVAVDGGGRLTLSGLLADIRLTAVNRQEWKLLLGGTEQSGRVFAILPAMQAAEAALDLLHRLAAQGTKARGRDLAVDLPPNQTTAISTSPFGLFTLSAHLSAIGIGPAFGQAGAESLAALCIEAERIGIRSVKPALDHSLIFFGAADACAALAGFAADMGFIATSRDLRSHIATCPGSPACASALIPTHAIATETAARCGDLLDGSFRLHVSGCPKGCANPQPAALTLCGTPTGLSFIHQGKATQQPFATVAFADTNATLARLADLVGSERRAGENAAACLARLGPDRLAAAIKPERPSSGRS